MVTLHPNDGEDSTLRLYAWLSHNEEGVEGVLLGKLAGGTPVPLISTDRDQALRLGIMAKRLAYQSGRTVRLVQFERGMTLAIEQWRRR